MEAERTREAEKRLDVAHTDVAEVELTRMVEKRSSSGGEQDPDEREELYMESVRRFHERRRRENAAAWYAFHDRMREAHARLAAEHAAKAEKLCEGPGGGGLS
jgi:hypothetical protein